MVKRVRADSSPSNSNPTSRSRDPSVETTAHTPKYTSLDPEESVGETSSSLFPSSTSTCRSRRIVMECTLPPHAPLTFPSYAGYEVHYNQAHTNRCRACGRNFPSAHYLDLHQTEHHDPLAAARRARGEKTFGCFVEGCGRVCGDPTKRRRHCVDAHAFPRNYDFFVVDVGIDGRRSLLRPGVDARGHRRSSREGGGEPRQRRRRPGPEAEAEAGDVTLSQQQQQQQQQGSSTEERRGGRDEDGTAGDAESLSPMPVTVKVTVADSGVGHVAASKDGISVDDLAKSMSSLRFVPSSITFGKRRSRAGFAKS